jgi:outer membrane protein TolC
LASLNNKESPAGMLIINGKQMRKKGWYILLLMFCAMNMQAQKTLEEYINAAKTNSPLIQDNKNLSEAAKIEVERLKAFYSQPQVALTATYAFSPIISLDNAKPQFVSNPADANKYIGYDIAASNGGVYQGLINVNQPLFNSAKLKTSSEQALVAGQINQNNIQIGGHDIEKIVADQYILCLQDLKQIDYLNNLIKLIEDQKFTVARFAENGLLKQSDLLLVNIEAQTQQNAMNSFKATYKRDLMDLNILCGINDTTYLVLPDINMTINAPVQNSKFTQKYSLDSLNFSIAEKVYELKYKPQLFAYANAGLNAVYMPTLPNRFGMTAGFNFAWNLYDGKQKDFFRKKTDLQIQSAQSYKNNFVNQNEVRKNKILNDISSLNDRMAMAAGQLKDYQTLLDYYKKELLTGQQSVVTYVNTVKNLAALQRDFVLMQTNKQLLINLYNYWNW